MDSVKMKIENGKRSLKMIKAASSLNVLFFKKLAINKAISF
jgi:hypothetical protein